MSEQNNNPDTHAEQPADDQKPNYIHPEDTFKPAIEGQPALLVLPPDSHTEINKVTSKLNDGNVVKSAQTEEWIGLLNLAVKNGVPFDSFYKAANDKLRDWAPNFEHQGTKYGPAAPVFRVEENAVLVGSSAVKRCRSIIGNGRDFQVPMYSSGFWLTIEPFTEATVLDIFHDITSRKIDLGRSTNGAVFSNMTVILNDVFLQHAVRHIVSCTADLPNDDYLSYLSTTDIGTLALAFLSKMYPEGVNYARPVVPKIVDDEGNQLAEVTVRKITECVNIMRMHKVDRSRLNEEQRMHMAKRNPRATTLKEVERYQESLINPAKITTPGGEINFTVKVPSARKFLEYGNLWIDTLQDTLNQTLTDDVTDVERNNRLFAYAKSSQLRQYGHWITDLTYTETNETANDAIAIDGVLEYLSGNDKIRTSLNEQIREYIEGATVSICAVPTANENEDNRLAHRRFPHLVPIDPLQTFFTLLALKVQSINSRS